MSKAVKKGKGGDGAEAPKSSSKRTKAGHLRRRKPNLRSPFRPDDLAKKQTMSAERSRKAIEHAAVKCGIAREVIDRTQSADLIKMINATEVSL